MDQNYTLRLKTGLAEMLKGGVIMDVTTATLITIFRIFIFKPLIRCTCSKYNKPGILSGAGRGHLTSGLVDR